MGKEITEADIKVCNLDQKYYDYIQELYGLDKAEFLKVIEENGQTIEDIFDDLSIREYDDEMAAVLIDALEDAYAD